MKCLYSKCTESRCSCICWIWSTLSWSAFWRGKRLNTSWAGCSGQWSFPLLASQIWRWTCPSEGLFLPMSFSAYLTICSSLVSILQVAKPNQTVIEVVMTDCWLRRTGPTVPVLVMQTILDVFTGHFNRNTCASAHYPVRQSWGHSA